MKAIAKKITISDNVTTIKLEHDKYTSNNRVMRNQIKALYCLLGGYNEYGRHIEVNQFLAIQDKFNEVINELTELIY